VIGKSEGKRQLRRHSSRWEDNIRMDLGEIGWKVVECMQLDQERDQCAVLVNKVMNLRVE
jgi:uncharacterized cysteine cluster protein YcgN (CxxCxxCC family)